MISIEKRMDKRFADFANRWLQPGAKSERNDKPFRRLSCVAKTVETVSRLFLLGRLAEASC
jgi:hypothetical protein